MPDISDKNRVFIVHAHGGRGNENYETIEVEAGEDADEVCADLLDTMIGNHFDTGWGEASKKDLKSLVKNGFPAGCAPIGYSEKYYEDDDED